MSLLNSKFDIVSVDNPLALAALAQVLEVDVLPSPPIGTNGTPAAGVIPPGAIVMMEADGSDGKAVLATTPNFLVGNTLPVMPFVTIDGNMDYSGAFVQKITVLHGGFTMSTDQYNGASFPYGKPVTFRSGKVELAVAGDQILGFVGPGGLDTTAGTLQVIVPQGSGIAYPVVPTS